ncbi:MAG: radical SAM protein [Candidatus Bathyarchaeota archaeon]|nr:radical SAM protein [Candidatus Bathyarchaeum tardum]WNZ29700.1 MAG: radical SAM protein [Candidatus Bathyarchaeota archaeon]
MKEKGFIEKIRVSIGSAIVLDLKKGSIDVKPTTAYLLLGRGTKCLANCSFCTQAKHSNSRANMLSRVTWPEFPAEEVISSIEKAAKTAKIKRICVQSLNYPQVFGDVLCLVKKIKTKVDVPISVSCKPLNKEQAEHMFQAGVNRICIALDAATEQIFEKIKGTNVGAKYKWIEQRKALQEAVTVFGYEFVSTHLIVGLGETEKELCQTIQWCVDSRIKPALFAFTPIKGTALENNLPPQLSYYRRTQVANFLLTKGKTTIREMEFDNNGKITSFGVTKEDLMKTLQKGEPFLTSGCPDCNRPYYNEKPSGPLYNYPRSLLPKEVEKERKNLGF